MSGKLGRHWKLSEKIKEKMRMAHIGKKYKPMSKEGKTNISNSLKGRKMPIDVRKKMALSRTGEKNHAWKGDKVKYRALHDWVGKYKPESICCEECGKIKRLSLANISRKYLRDINDYRWLCYKCHKNFDIGRKKN